MGTNTILNKSTAISPDERFCRLIEVESDFLSNFQVRGRQSVGTQVYVKDKRGYVWILILLLVLLLACVITEAAVFLLRSHDCEKSHAFQATTTRVNHSFATFTHYTDLTTTVTSPKSTGTAANNMGTTRVVPNASSSNPIHSTTSNPQLQVCITEHWTQWINRDRPESSNGDHEVLTDAEKTVLCPGGKMTIVECNVEAGDIPSYASGEVLTCDVRTGLTCYNTDNFPIPCSDYKIRYFCQCSNISSHMSISTTSTTSTTSTAQPTVSNTSAQNMTIGSRGKRFIILFTTNVDVTEKTVIVTSDQDFQMSLTTSDLLDVTLKAQIDRTINVSSVEYIAIPSHFELQSFQTEVKMLLIETSEDVFVISHDNGDRTVASTTHIPLHKLSTKYIAVTTDGGKSQIALAAIEDNTNISMIFAMKRYSPLFIDGNYYHPDEVFKMTLNRFENFEIEHDTELTGTVIQSSVPIAAFSGNDCSNANNPGGCEHIFDQLPPVESLDNQFIIPPNSDDRDTLVRILAVDSFSNVSYKVDGITQTMSLNQLDLFETRISSNQICYIESNQPLLVTSIGLHSKTSDIGDPAVTISPGLNQYLDYYKIVVPFGYDHNYVSIMIKESSKNSFRINGSRVSVNDIVFQGNVLANNVPYRVVSIRVPEGEMTASTVDGERFGLMFAGVTYFEAYGFSGNSLLL